MIITYGEFFMSCQGHMGQFLDLLLGHWEFVLRIQKNFQQQNVIGKPTSVWFVEVSKKHFLSIDYLSVLLR